MEIYRTHIMGFTQTVFWLSQLPYEKATRYYYYFIDEGLKIRERMWLSLSHVTRTESRTPTACIVFL